MHPKMMSKQLLKVVLFTLKDHLQKKNIVLKIKLNNYHNNSNKKKQKQIKIQIRFMIAIAKDLILEMIKTKNYLLMRKQIKSNMRIIKMKKRVKITKFIKRIKKLINKYMIIQLKNINMN